MTVAQYIGSHGGIVMPYLTLGQASRETGVHKSTISRAIQDGRLSATHNEHGHYQIDPAELFRVFSPAPSETQNETPSSAEGNSAQPLLQPTATPAVGHEMVPWLVKRLESTEQELSETKDELSERDRSLQELREAYRALPSPERQQAELDRVREQHRQEIEKRDAEKVRLLAMERHQHEKESEEWKAELLRRKEEIQLARETGEVLRQRTEQEREARELLSQRLADIESRGLFDRLFNRKVTTTAG